MIDDDRVSGRSLCRALAKLRPSYAVELSTSSEMAISRLSSGGYDVVVMDLELPSIPAPALFERIARERPEVIRVAHSSRSEATQRCEPRPRVDAVVGKPVTPLRLLAVIEQVLAAEPHRRGGLPGTTNA
ncbi:MAG: response regulator [Pseudomonadota bacterium]